MRHDVTQICFGISPIFFYSQLTVVGLFVFALVRVVVRGSRCVWWRHRLLRQRHQVSYTRSERWRRRLWWSRDDVIRCLAGSDVWFWTSGILRAWITTLVAYNPENFENIKVWNAYMYITNASKKKLKYIGLSYTIRVIIPRAIQAMIYKWYPLEYINPTPLLLPPPPLLLLTPPFPHPSRFLLVLHCIWS